ncbi:MAG TPA: MBL fold metallo-hydrolase [Gemmatimonadales bacterium]|jgi:L-ascorbate metabolism protein UlaG (beta-lactamase superfamily)|nr:MBL fold metallo-hydrolase [Gemmatimonadales bacterium]
MLRVTYIDGPTALIELGGVRFLTDPTFDPAGTEYRTATYVLRKTTAPAISATALGALDAVLLSHDHHFDNLDHAGRLVLRQAERILTTPEGAGRLGPTATGLAPWESVDLPARDGRPIRVTALPARHGPAGGDRGPVIGFALAYADDPARAIYLSGDTVWFDQVAAIATRMSVQVAFLFMGAARVLQVGPAHLTFTATEAIDAARVFAPAPIVPLHFEGWAHFSESREGITQVFRAAGLEHRLVWLEPGRPTELTFG